MSSKPAIRRAPAGQERAKAGPRAFVVAIHILASFPCALCVYLLGLVCWDRLLVPEFGVIAALVPVLLVIGIAVRVSIREELALVVLVQSLPYAAWVFFIGWKIQFAPAYPLGAFLSAAVPTVLVALCTPPVRRGRMAAGTAALMLMLMLITAAVVKAPVVGGLAAAAGTAGVALWMMPKTQGGLWRQWFGTGLVMVFASMAIASYFDWPAFADPLPDALGGFAAGRQAAAFSRFHRYPLSGSDEEWLWRIDANPDVLQLISSKLEMSETAEAPSQFWHMPPHYWPRHLPSGAQLFATPGFLLRGRGSGGPRYFMLVDGRRGVGYVWVKIYPYPYRD